MGLSFAAAAVMGAPGEAARQTPDDEVLRKWSRSCALCHVNGNGGAPRLGQAEDWRPRLEKGRETLLAHTVEGFNNMPPLGYCMACEREDFLALIDFMTDQAAAPRAEPR